MSLFNNPNYISFGGESVTGRVPPKTFVYGRGMNALQKGGVTHAYKLFCDMVRFSLAEYHVQERDLPDGTRIRMVSNNGIDTLHVWPAGGGGFWEELPHGFCVATNWHDVPFIYGKNTSENVWKLLAKVTHAKAGIKSSFQVVRAAENLVLPMVYTEDKMLRDYALHNGFKGSANVFILPITPKTVGEAYAVHRQYYIGDRSIYLSDGAVKYTATETNPILLSAPEEDHWLPALPSIDGAYTYHAQWRRATLSESANVVKFLYATDKVVCKRAPQSKQLYFELASREERQIVTPQVIDEVVGQDLSAPVLLGIEVEDKLTCNYISVEQSINGWLPGLHEYTAAEPWWGQTTWGTKTVFVDLDENGSIPRINAETAFTEYVIETYGLPVITPLLTFPHGESQGYITIINSLTYPATTYWRAGEKKVQYEQLPWFPSYPPITAWTTKLFASERIDSKYTVDIPYVKDGGTFAKLDLVWDSVEIVRAVVHTDFTGELYTDTSEGNCFTPYPDGLPTAHYHPGTPSTYAELLEGDLTPYILEIYAAFGPGPNKYVTNVVSDVPVSNTVSYTYTSRYLVDHDGDIEFYSCIVVEVECPNAEWGQDQTHLRGVMAPVRDPTYTVIISFETKWRKDGVVISKEIYRGSFTKPPFEFKAIPKTNPYLWGTLAELENPTIIHTAPTLKVNDVMVSQVVNAFSSQYRNPNLAGMATSIPETVSGVSKVGIEYSFVKDDIETPHTKRVKGLLYRRTVKLSNYLDAFWMLTYLTIDAAENNDTLNNLPKWFYAPDLKAAIDNLSITVERRDDDDVKWSDELPGTSSAPPFEDRQIALYEV